MNDKEQSELRKEVRSAVCYCQNMKSTVNVRYLLEKSCPVGKLVIISELLKWGNLICDGGQDCTCII